jgi:hypothetical protein
MLQQLSLILAAEMETDLLFSVPLDLGLANSPADGAACQRHEFILLQKL